MSPEQTEDLIDAVYAVLADKFKVVGCEFDLSDIRTALETGYLPDFSVLRDPEADKVIGLAVGHESARLTAIPGADQIESLVGESRRPRWVRCRSVTKTS